MTYEQKIQKIDDALKFYLPEQAQIDQLRQLLEEIRQRTGRPRMRNFYFPKSTQS